MKIIPDIGVVPGLLENLFCRKIRRPKDCQVYTATNEYLEKNEGDVSGWNGVLS